MKFDDLLLYVGEFGLFQKRVYLLLCLFCIIHGMRMVVLVFILHIPRHRCAIPGYLNDTYEITSLEHQAELNRSVPDLDFCHVFAPGNYSYDLENRPINAELVKCEQWVYDTSDFYSTVASQFDLVCDNAGKRSHATMTFYGGFLIGVFVLGAVSDLIGRKSCLFLSLTLLTALGMGLAFANSFLAFAIINFFVGASATGIFSSAFVIGIELVGPSKRTYTGMFIQLFFSLGVVAVAGLAYLVRDGQFLQIAITAPLILFFLTWWMIPESPRWQIQRGQMAKARATVIQAAKVNKTQVPESVLDDILPVDRSDEEKTFMENSNHHDHNPAVNGYIVVNGGQKNLVNGDDKQLMNTEEMGRKVEEKGRLVDLFTSKELFIRTCIIFFNWAVVSLTFYGLNFNVGNLGAGSIFLNFFLAGLVEFPAHITTILTVDRFGRRIVHCAMMITSGVACLACVASIIFVPAGDQWLTIALAMLGKFGAAGGFGTIYLYSTEIFPTVIRNSALGASSSWARVGAMLAPYVAAQGAKAGGHLGRGVPLLIFGGLILAAGILSIFLPETLNRKLPETVNDAKMFTKVIKVSDTTTAIPSISDPTKTSSDCDSDTKV